MQLLFSAWPGPAHHTAESYENENNQGLTSNATINFKTQDSTTDITLLTLYFPVGENASVRRVAVLSSVRDLFILVAIERWYEEQRSTEVRDQGVACGRQRKWEKNGHHTYNYYCTCEKPANEIIWNN
jgi:hypothetical protein